MGWTETANISTVVYDNNYIGYACAFKSQGDVEILLHATGEPGLHFIDLCPAIDKGKERGHRIFVSCNSAMQTIIQAKTCRVFALLSK